MWTCGHSHGIDNSRCVRCMRARPKNYVYCVPLGGVPGRWRSLCDSCLAVYTELGMIGQDKKPTQQQKLGLMRTAGGQFTAEYNRKFHYGAPIAS